MIKKEFKAFADNKKIMIQKLNILLGKVVNMVKNGENAGCQRFLLFS